MVSLVMMALAFGVPKPPCSGPAQNVTSGKLALTFHAFLKERIHRFSNLTISCESQFAMSAEYLKILHLKTLSFGPSRRKGATPLASRPVSKTILRLGVSPKARAPRQPDDMQANLRDEIPVTRGQYVK